ANLEGRVCMVTGATSGHGRAVATGLARQGAHVVLLGRNPEKCRAVQREIAAENGGKAPDIVLCDLSSRSEIDRAASEYLASGRPLHVLVNNAGLVNLKRRETGDGVEMVFAVNYLAYFQLALRLLPRLRDSAPARIVNVSSDTHKIAKLDLDDLELCRRYSWLRSYGRSKLAIVYFTLELARRLEGTGVTVNAVDPGPVASSIGDNNPGPVYTLLAPLIRAARLLVAQTLALPAPDTDISMLSQAKSRASSSRAATWTLSPAPGRSWRSARMVSTPPRRGH
ncbi:MAG: SDR family NAD(P)-dependent oxidoreductase, partial [Proteobacteria bacterium]|nr:SDR family NAD(P)-dependent oxidoreductase [Pseudomonadota bacterium]